MSAQCAEEGVCKSYVCPVIRGNNDNNNICAAIVNRRPVQTGPDPLPVD